MATYDFKCKNEKCGLVEEYICPIAECPEVLKCKRCGSDSVQAYLTPRGVLTGNMTHAPIDVVIGRDAAKRWDRIHANKAMRDKIRQETGKQHIEATPVGEFGAKDYKGSDKQLQFVSTPEPK
jgi:hypothetical protein